MLTLQGTLPCPALPCSTGQGRAGFVFFSAEQGRAGQGTGRAGCKKVAL